VPYISLGEMWPKTMGDPDFLPRGATHVRVCGYPVDALSWLGGLRSHPSQKREGWDTGNFWVC
jgi:hypothetical protein